MLRPTATFQCIVDCPDYSLILDRVPGTWSVYVFDAGLGNWIVSSCSFERDQEDYDAECEQAIEDARRVSWLLDGVELGEW